MGVWQGILIGAGAMILVYVLFLVWLVAAGRREARKQSPGSSRIA